MNLQSGGGEYVLWISKYPCSYQGEGSFELIFGSSSTFTWPVASYAVASDWPTGVIGDV